MYRKRLAEYEEKFPSAPEEKNTKSSSTVRTPKKYKAKKLHVDKPTSNDIIFVTPNSTKKSFPPVVTNATPTSIGCLHPKLDTLSFFPDIFELEDTSVDEPIPMNCVSGVSDTAFSIVTHPSSEFMLDDFSHLQIFPDIFELEDPSVDEPIPMNCVSNVNDAAFSIATRPSSEFMLDDFTHLPIFHAEEKEAKKPENVVSVDDFMELNATLDG